MYIAITGRQPDISMAELERCFGSDNVQWFSPIAALIDTDALNIEQLGGTVKAGKVALRLPRATWQQASQQIISHYSQKWHSHDSKITLGISAYGFDISPREVQKLGIIIKSNLKKNGTSLRLIPNAAVTLNTATSHHNKLGLSPSKVELLIIRNGESGDIIVAESSGAQNITALARRDQGRPKRDAFVGMLPPKLALLMLNLAASEQKSGKNLRVLDPFCGTGVVLQEAALRGYNVYGTDLSDKMIDYTKENLEWLKRTHHTDISVTLKQADATNATWQQPIDLVVSETYLGQPFSAFPSNEKLREVQANVSRILTAFLMNIGPQLKPGTPLCLAIPAWHDPPTPEEAKRGSLGEIISLQFGISPKNGGHYAKFDDMLNDMGYFRPKYKNTYNNGIHYYRPDQIVARELLVLVKK
jgi:tRNA (guanine10-N2)-dimethyltransferase